ncbi:MAG: GTPase HflX [Clostridia bacterium]|nr:GTPase HflX [Clostridia bacterium]
MSEMNETRAILVTVAERGTDVPECERSLDELERLLETAGGSCFAKIIQVKESFDPRTCIGKGKVTEIKELCEANGIDLVIFDFELTPAQIRNLENDIGVASVIDRSMLILDIFALHATSGEGKLQVELAQLKYSAPRLIGKGSELSRQGGGIGTRGPGESKLETDRRHLHERVVALERKLEELEENRATMRRQRDKSGLTKVALVGYTNAGKSSLLNKLTGADVLAQDKLFATLDPTTRKMELPDGVSILLTDTVGFIRKLPHHLVKAFKSTLDEVRYADILLIVSDASDPEAQEHIAVAREVISDLDSSDKPTVYVYNKCDTLENAEYGIRGEDRVNVSAKTGEGIDGLLSLIGDVIMRTKRVCRLLIPYSEQGIVSSLYNSYTVSSVEYTDSGVEVVAVLDARGMGLYADLIKGEP